MRTKAVALVAGVAGLAGCGGETDGLLFEQANIVYGADDRAEYFEAPSDALRARMADSTVAFVGRSTVRVESGRLVFDAQTWGETGGLCPGERFADQTTAAFCTGVLVDWDLVLTAGHCVHLLPLEDFWLVFGYYLDAPGQLAAAEGDLVAPSVVVAEARDPAGVEPRLDYALIRLARPVASPRRPVPLRRRSMLAVGEALVAIGAVGGTPLKLDAGGSVRDARPETSDYFLADTDTAHGSSGGGAFDRDLVLAGVLARGGSDFVPTADGCYTTARVPDPGAAEEQFTYVGRAVDGLCRDNPTASSLCRADCGEPCEALPLPAPAGCSVAAADPGPRHDSNSGAAIALTIVTAAVARRRSVRERSRSFRSRDDRGPASVGPLRVPEGGTRFARAR